VATPKVPKFSPSDERGFAECACLRGGLPTGNRNGRNLWGVVVPTSSGKRSLYDWLQVKTRSCVK